MKDFIKTPSWVDSNLILIFQQNQKHPIFTKDLKMSINLYEGDKMQTIGHTSKPTANEEFEFFKTFCHSLRREINKADAKHGSWKFDSHGMMAFNVSQEMLELVKAVEKNDVHGEHGMKAECLHVAVTAYKMWREL